MMKEYCVVKLLPPDFLLNHSSCLLFVHSKTQHAMDENSGDTAQFWNCIHKKYFLPQKGGNQKLLFLLKKRLSKKLMIMEKVSYFLISSFSAFYHLFLMHH